METIEDVHSKFKTNIDQFLSVIQLVLDHVKSGLEMNEIIIDENAKTIKNFFDKYKSEVFITVMKLIINNVDAGVFLEKFASNYSDHWDEIFSSECNLKYFQKKISILFKASGFSDENSKNSSAETFIKNCLGSAGVETSLVTANFIEELMTKILDLKSLDNTNYVTENYISRILAYIRSFSRSSIKHIFIKRVPIKIAPKNSRDPHVTYIFKNNDLLPNVNISRCIHFYGVDVSKLHNLS